MKRILAESRIKGKHMFATIAVVAMMLTGLVALIRPSTMQAQAATTSPPYFAVEPSVYYATSVGEMFNVSILIHNVDPANNITGFEFRLGYDPTLLSVVAFYNGTFLNGPAAPPNGGVLYYGPYYRSNPDGSAYVLFAGFILPDPNILTPITWHPPLLSGTGTVATVTFKVLSMPPKGVPPTNLTLYDTLLPDTTSKVISSTAVRGSVDISAPTGDLNGDHVVNILDAIIFENAFGSYPGAANWNALADMNHDGFVNILDAIMLANNFGQTV